MLGTIVVRSIFVATVLMVLSPSIQAAGAPPAIFRKDARILFQGDSITDGGRGRTSDPNHILGHSYAYLIAADFGGHFPERNLTFFNRGVSGNKIPDLVARWERGDRGPSICRSDNRCFYKTLKREGVYCPHVGRAGEGPAATA